MIESFIELGRFLFEDPLVDLHASGAKQSKSSAGVIRVRVSRGDNHASNSERHDRLRARRRPPMRATRFQRNVKRRTFYFVSSLLSVADCFNFRVRPSGATMPA